MLEIIVFLPVFALETRRFRLDGLVIVPSERRKRSFAFVEHKPGGLLERGPPLWLEVPPAAFRHDLALFADRYSHGLDGRAGIRGQFAVKEPLQGSWADIHDGMEVFPLRNIGMRDRADQQGALGKLLGLVLQQDVVVEG